MRIIYTGANDGTWELLQRQLQMQSLFPLSLSLFLFRKTSRIFSNLEAELTTISLSKHRCRKRLQRESRKMMATTSTVLVRGAYLPLTFINFQMTASIRRPVRSETNFTFFAASRNTVRCLVLTSIHLEFHPHNLIHSVSSLNLIPQNSRSANCFFSVAVRTYRPSNAQSNLLRWSKLIVSKVCRELRRI